MIVGFSNTIPVYTKADLWRRGGLWPLALRRGLATMPPSLDEKYLKIPLLVQRWSWVGPIHRLGCVGRVESNV